MQSERSDQFWMEQALGLAAKAQALDEVPVGAVVVLDNEIIGRGWNQPISSHDPSAHAEIMALRDAGQKVGNYRLINSSLYVTIEPCAMCAGALIHARVARVVYGAKEPKSGVAESNLQFFSQGFLNHQLELEGGVCEEACSDMIREFFRQRRLSKKAQP